MSGATTLECGYCLSALDDDDVRRCDACGAVHHADCWIEYGGCTVFGCSAWMERQMIASSPPQPLPAPVGLPAPQVATTLPPPSAPSWLAPTSSEPADTARRAVEETAPRRPSVAPARTEWWQT